MAKANISKPALFFSPTYKSPQGSSLFAKLTEPDVFQGGEPTWKITLVFDPKDPEFVAFQSQVSDFAQAFSKECGKKVDPLKSIGIDKNTGLPCMTFKSKVRLDDAGRNVKIPSVDATKTAIDKEPWNGDLCRVAFKFGGWQSALGVGIKPYLSAVQVLERRPKSTFNNIDVFDSTPVVTDECPF